MKRTCLATGCWRCCLSMKIMSSVPTWSTIINQFLCVLCAFPNDRSKLINKYVYHQSQGAVQILKNWINTCTFQIGFQLSSAASVEPLRLCFWQNCCGRKRRKIYLSLCGLYAFPCARASNLNQQYSVVSSTNVCHKIKYRLRKMFFKLNYIYWLCSMRSKWNYMFELAVKHEA